MIPPRVRALLAGFADLVWPRACALCAVPIEGADSAGWLCPGCLAAITSDGSDNCPRCASTVGPHTELTGGCPRCRGTRYRFAAATRLGPYDGRLREVVLRLKQESGEALAEQLGEVFADVRREKLLAHDPAVVVPIPLHWRRRWTRGYNQSEAIARGLAVGLDRSCRPGWLVRVRPTPTQQARSRTERWENVRGAFRVGRFAGARGVRVLLVDDVLTTGATADAAAAALLDAGAAQVTVAVLAHR